jgi:phosphatidate phosphatase APP1
MKGSIVGCCVLLFIGAASARASDLKSDEIIVFHPSYLTWHPEAGHWRGVIRGQVCEPADGGSERLKLALLRELPGVDRDLTDEEERIFRARADGFFVDGERGKRIAVRIGDRTFTSRHSRPDGHFVVKVFVAGGEAGDTLAFVAELAKEDPRRFGGTLRLLGPIGTSVISDIDDTVKKSDVLDRRELLANTFLRPFEPVPGMPERYEEWGRQGAVFHYVTGSPWQLYRPLWEFLEDHGFPGVEIGMRRFRLKDSSAVHFFRDPHRYKTARVREILRRFPERRFVLVGDSGERDPHVYAEIAREFPVRVRGIFIRAVLEPHRDRSRYREVFEGIEDTRWVIFRDAAELPGDLALWGAAGDRRPSSP